MKVLIVGAGGMAGYTALRFSQSGAEVTIAAKGERIEQLNAGGFRMREAYSGSITSIPVRVVDSRSLDKEITSGPVYDLVLIAVKSYQAESLLPQLKDCPPAVPIVFAGSYATGIGDWAAELGPDRSFFAFPGSTAVGDEEGIIEYVDRGGESGDNWGVTLGWLRPEDVSPESEQLFGKVEELFRDASLPVYRSDRMQSVFLSQAAVRLPIMAAVRMTGGSLDTLYVRGDLLKLMIKGIRESLAALKASGYSPIPSSLEMYRWVPIFMSANMMKHRFDTTSSRVGIESFASHASDETAFLARQMLALAERAKTPRDHLLYLFSEFEDEDEDEDEAPQDE
ncbi:MAG: 2-dehydropantoate 2-reductase N-terminal domain-containing protein [Spirochaetota bacterium]|nr:2-dehydropantoate 2-reductase N-terminal domain-containing protein [Spirochaetota bacterium]